MSLTTPDTIRTLQRKLYAKAKQENADVAYSSIECAGSTNSVELANMSRGTAHALV